MKKRIISLITVILMLSLLLSCEKEVVIPDREYNEKEVIVAAKTLIEKSELLNKLFWGEGIKYNPDPTYASGYYYMADYFSLDEYGVETIDDIDKKAREVFSEDYSNQIFASTVFSSASDSNGNLIYFARYMQKSSTTGKPEYIQVYSKWKQFLFDTVVYDYDSISVSGVNGEKVFVEIDVTVTDAESEKKQNNTIKVALIEESDGWRIDSPTYSSYINK